MIIVSYDISNNKLRTRFSKYLSKFGFRLQYSVFQIQNSERVLNNIIARLDKYFGKYFEESDSVIIFNLSANCKKITYGYANNLESDFLLIK